MKVVPTRSFEDVVLAPYRQIGDKAADVAVATIAAQAGREGLAELMRYLGDFQNLSIVGQSPEIQDFFHRHRQLPDFADLSQMEKAMAFFWRHNQPIAFLLGCYSLPYCYAAADGAQVLWLSQRIKNDTYKRLEETGEFVFGIMQERDWRNERNILKILKIRLMHAVIRYYTNYSAQWEKAWGLPVNQEDMAGTNLAFSYIVIRGLRKSGIIAQTDDEEAYLHLWRVIGALLGVEEALLPLNLREAFHLDRVIAKRQFKPSVAGAGLTKALVNVLQQQAPMPVLRNFPVAQMRFLLGDRLADMLKLPAVPLEEKMIRLTAQFPFFKNGFRSSESGSAVLEKYRR
ncbi:MAG: oxygenase MpaB family protein [Spirosomataceae bacterium]